MNGKGREYRPGVVVPELVDEPDDLARVARRARRRQWLMRATVLYVCVAVLRALSWWVL